MRIRLLFVGRTDRGFVADGLAEYLGRMARMAEVEAIIVPEERGADPERQRAEEGQRVLGALKPGERLVALDERGELLTSPAFAARLGAWRDSGTRQIAFAVGGAYGHSDAVRARADLVLALSPMTFPHQLVRVLFAEQLYRALMILNRRPYHH
ncbi:MAG: 23S rRNA (pseudouridine(1915)-N(3))-methyltransferase RlmH [Flavobacteriales bacterium]|nr:23S rRNA (pseudouridine(1915)-N(3))-methyltransferase RlmH [Flavobacteriales bacterium]